MTSKKKGSRTPDIKVSVASLSQTATFVPLLMKRVGKLKSEAAIPAMTHSSQ
jgi:hypothetical protein